MILVERRGAAAPVHILTLLFFVAVALALAGCTAVAPPPETKLPTPQFGTGQLIESLTQRREQFHSVRALAQIDYSGPDGKHGFQEAVLVERPDRLRLETLTFMGAILIVTANNKEIVGYHPREGVFVRGQGTKDNLRRYTQIPLELEEITMLLLGLPPVNSSAPPSQEGNTVVFSAHGQKRDVVSFESQQPVPTKWERFNGDGKVELSAEFADYVSTPAGPFPTRINFEANLQKKKVQIRYEQPEVNPKISSNLFSQQIPPNTKEVPIEAIGS